MDWSIDNRPILPPQQTLEELYEDTSPFPYDPEIKCSTFFEVNLEYPIELHDEHSDHRLTPEIIGFEHSKDILKMNNTKNHSLSETYTQYLGGKKDTFPPRENM